MVVVVVVVVAVVVAAAVAVVAEIAQPESFQFQNTEKRFAKFYIMSIMSMNVIVLLTFSRNSV